LLAAAGVMLNGLLVVPVRLVLLATRV